MEIKVSVPAIEKLLDYSASGIGSVAGLMLTTYRARREAKAKAINAEGEVEAQRILTAGQSDTLQIIAAAQANAREALVAPNSNVQGQLDLSETVTQRIQFQEEKRQSNIGAVVGLAAAELEDKDVGDHEPDHDWTARFFGDIQDVSTEDTQLLYAKILAGAVERPGSTSLKALSILKDLDRSTAVLFRNFCSTCISLSPDGDVILDTRAPSLGGDATQNALREFGLSFDNLNILNEHGLIISDYTCRFDYRMCISTFASDEQQNNMVVRVPFKFQNRFWLLNPTTEREIGAAYNISGIALTKAGRELERVLDCEPILAYGQELEKYFASQGLGMIEAENSLPQIIGQNILPDSV